MRFDDVIGILSRGVDVDYTVAGLFETDYLLALIEVRAYYTLCSD